MLKVAVIGAGPAGVATALSILQCATSDVVVTLYYRRPGRRWTVGETLPPAAYGELNHLGAASVLRPDVHLPCAGSLSVWSTEEMVANDFILDPHGTGYHLDREQFEVDLRRLVSERGARICPDHTLRQVEANAAGYQLTFHTGGGDVVTEADFVVDASGQSAGFARRLPVARNCIDEVVSLYRVMAAPRAMALPDYTLLEATPHGWWYLSRVPGNRCVLSLTTDREALREQALMSQEGWSRCYRQSRWLPQFLPEAHVNEGVLACAPATSSILSCCVGERWLAVGDAACSYDSITSAGITKSLIQGRLAGKALVNWNNGDSFALEHYQASVFDQFNHYIGLRASLYRQASRFSGHGFWRRRHRIAA